MNKSDKYLLIALGYALSENRSDLAKQIEKIIIGDDDHAGMESGKNRGGSDDTALDSGASRKAEPALTAPGQDDCVFCGAPKSEPCPMPCGCPIRELPVARSNGTVRDAVAEWKAKQTRKNVEPRTAGVLVQNGYNPPAFQCSMCDARFNDLEAYQDHVHSVHEIQCMGLNIPPPKQVKANIDNPPTSILCPNTRKICSSKECLAYRTCVETCED